MKCAGASDVASRRRRWVTEKHKATGNEDVAARQIQRLQSAISAALQLAPFPHFISIAGYSIHPHRFFESLGYAAAFAIFMILRARRGDSLPYPLRWATLATAFAGAGPG